MVHFFQYFCNVNKNSSCVYTNMVWAESCIICTVNISKKALVKWIFLLSITISGKSTFTITITIGQKLSFGHPWLKYLNLIDEKPYFKILWQNLNSTFTKCGKVRAYYKKCDLPSSLQTKSKSVKSITFMSVGYCASNAD